MESFKKFNYKLNFCFRELKVILFCFKKYGCFEWKY